MSITTSTGCMLKNNATGELLPIVSLEFNFGGAISGICTLEDGSQVFHNAKILEAEYDIELITCLPGSYLVLCPLCDGECDTVIDDLATACPACKGGGHVTPAHAIKIKSDIKEGE